MTHQVLFHFVPWSGVCICTSTADSDLDNFVKPGARGLQPCTPGFLKSLSFVRQYACMCISVCLCVCPEGIDNQWHDMV